MRKKYAQRNLGRTFGDSRLQSRFKTLCEHFEMGLTAAIPQICETKAMTKSAYRFFDNKNVTVEKMLQEHRAELESGLSAVHCGRVLQLSDSSELDYTGKKGASTLGSLNYLYQKGMLLHSSVLLSEIGLPLGLLWQNYIVRSEEDFGKSEERMGLPIEEKETQRWLDHFEEGQNWLTHASQTCPETELVYVADSEADIMELFQSRRMQNAHLLIRSKHDRLLADKTSHLYSTLRALVPQGRYEQQIVDAKTLLKRTAILEVRFCPVQLVQHRKVKSKPNRSVVQFQAIHIKEIDPPEGLDKPIEWVLLTTLPVTSFEEALTVIRYYLLRWLIERFHYLLKSGGAAVEELQLERVHRLQNAVTIYSIATFKAFKIRYWAEKCPSGKISEAGISPVEYQALYIYAHHAVDKKIVFDPDNQPTIEHFCEVLGRIAGFMPSSRQKLPGLKIISRALLKLRHITDAYLIFCQRTE